MCIKYAPRISHLRASAVPHIWGDALSRLTAKMFSELAELALQSCSVGCLSILLKEIISSLISQNLLQYIWTRKPGSQSGFLPSRA